MKKKKEKKRGLLLPVGITNRVTPGWYYLPGVKVPPLLPVVNLYSRKRTPG
jgi:hypothetical protein